MIETSKYNSKKERNWQLRFRYDLIELYSEVQNTS